MTGIDGKKGINQATEAVTHDRVAVKLNGSNDGIFGRGSAGGKKSNGKMGEGIRFTM